MSDVMTDSAVPPSAPPAAVVADAVEDAFAGVTESTPLTASSPLSETWESVKTVSKESGIDKVFTKGDQHAEFREQLRELQYWEVPANSALAVSVGTLIFYLTSGEGAYSLVSLVCLALLVRLLFVAGARKVLSSLDGNEKAKPIANVVERALLIADSILMIPSPTQVDKILKGSISILIAKVNCVCKSLAVASEPTPEGVKTLKRVLGYLILTIITVRFLSVWSICYLAFMHQMVWPAVYQRYQEKIDAAHDKFWTKAEPHVEKAKAKANELTAIAVEKGKVIGAAALEKGKVHYEQIVAKYREKTQGAAASTAEHPSEKTE